MCGRYAASADPDELIEAYDIDLDATERPTKSLLKNPQQPPAGTPDYNMAPTKAAPVVLSREPGERQLRLLTWGLVPSWAKDPKVGIRSINARAESVLTTATFKRPIRRRRALVPAAGWYEWQLSPTAVDAKGKPRKFPFFVTRSDDQPLAFAGVYEFWKDPAAGTDAGDDAWVVSFSIITTAAEPGLDRIHERQPVVLDSPDWSDWLDPELTDEHEISRMLAAAEAGRFQAWPVSTAVNRTATSDPSLIEPVAPSTVAGAVDPMTGEVWGD